MSKEGFDELFEAVQLAERYDLGVMSTKGMSVVAARNLIDSLAPHFDNILVLHDLDVSGFSILGTLGTDSRRYTFKYDLGTGNVTSEGIFMIRSVYPSKTQTAGGLAAHFDPST